MGLFDSKETDNKIYIKRIEKVIDGVNRIEDAKTLLENTKLSVTEISYSVGFADSNYFSNIFKKSVGLSPLAYRKKITEI